MDEKIFNIPGWMSKNELEFLHSIVKDAGNSALIVELGSWKGRSTAALYTAIHDSQTVVTIDTWLGQSNLRFAEHKEVLKRDIFLEFLDNMHNLIIYPAWYDNIRRGVCYLRMDSTDAVSLFDNGSIDVIIDDCDHRQVGLMIDIWRRKIKPGGIYCGHDFRSRPGVEAAVLDRFTISKVVDQIWVSYL